MPAAAREGGGAAVILRAVTQIGPARDLDVWAVQGELPGPPAAPAALQRHLGPD